MDSEATNAVMDVDDLERWLQRLRVPQRFGPIMLWLRDESRLDVLQPDDFRVHVDDNTVEAATRDGWRQILLEDVMSLGLRPRVPLALEPKM